MVVNRLLSEVDGRRRRQRKYDVILPVTAIGCQRNDAATGERMPVKHIAPPEIAFCMI